MQYDPAYRVALAEVRDTDAAAREAWRIARAIGAELPEVATYKQNNNEPVPLAGGPKNVFALRIHRGNEHQRPTVTFVVRGLDEHAAVWVLSVLGALGAAVRALRAEGSTGAGEGAVADPARTRPAA